VIEVLAGEEDELEQGEQTEGRAEAPEQGQEGEGHRQQQQQQQQEQQQEKEQQQEQQETQPPPAPDTGQEVQISSGALAAQHASGTGAAGPAAGQQAVGGASSGPAKKGLHIKAGKSVKVKSTSKACGGEAAAHPRNKPCTCGSNQKFKNCCGAAAAASSRRRQAAGVDREAAAELAAQQLQTLLI
jgi:hypothetical protein